MQQNSTKRLLVMAGGTGGHIFPAIAVAQYLQRQGWDICWLGTADRMEAQLVPKYGISIKFIQISGLRGKGITALLKAPVAITKAVLQARKIIKAYRPDAVLGMGGYVSGPGGIAAKFCGVPVILHEQNAVAGLTNKWLAKIANAVLQAFPTAFAQAKVLGNPVRADFFNLPSPEQRFAERTGKLRLLVVGGSQGAKVLNQTIPQVINQLSDKFEVYHQVGAGSLATVNELYNLQLKSDVKIVEFIDDIAQAYAWADLVICRSGALTVSELAAVGVAAIFVPFEHKDKQQYFNAKYLVDAGAAKIIEQSVFNAKTLMEMIEQLDRNQLAQMAISAKAMATPDSAKQVADIIVQNAN